MGSYLRPTTVTEAIEALARAREEGRPRVIVAGATDHYPVRVGRVADDEVIDISGLSGIRRIEAVDGGWLVPALATWTDVATAPLPPLFDGQPMMKTTAPTISKSVRNPAINHPCLFVIGT